VKFSYKGSSSGAKFSKKTFFLQRGTLNVESINLSSVMPTNLCRPTIFWPSRPRRKISYSRLDWIESWQDGP